MPREYTVQEKEKDRLDIEKLLFKPQENGGIKLDGLFKNMDECPFCGTETWSGDDGKTKIKPFVADKKTLTFRTKCCGVQGSYLSYTMLTHCKGKKKDDRGKESTPYLESVKWLKDFGGK